MVIDERRCILLETIPPFEAGFVSAGIPAVIITQLNRYILAIFAK
jgi:hypothetical protein